MSQCQVGGIISHDPPSVIDLQLRVDAVQRVQVSICPNGIIPVRYYCKYKLLSCDTEQYSTSNWIERVLVLKSPDVWRTPFLGA
jgi:hypothetical protein